MGKMKLPHPQEWWGEMIPPLLPDSSEGAGETGDTRKSFMVGKVGGENKWRL